MQPTPPLSSIVLTELNGFPLITIAANNNGHRRYVTAAFLSLWFIGWGMGAYSAASTLLAGEGNIGLAIWLLLWLGGGVVLARKLYQNVIYPRPERLLLNRPQLSYKPGVQSAKFARTAMRAVKGSDKRSRRQRKDAIRRIDFSAEEVATLHLSEVPQRLLIRTDERQVELGKGLNNNDIRWLYNALQEHYHLK
ncbi:hypothetical protein [Ferrimonas lipolytica]|uniref:Uncharacterized protein n=1 Tax=Ferrimonas lipolytica TaxID=2724191 RepID=A0A6H1UBU3_9GAMM|nr:hypothetical protein [Ferrimonas lipolytica]QIZ76531.1 hypothetical protein HER31_06445 [Ferrimonas lipolytica]